MHSQAIERHFAPAKRCRPHGLAYGTFSTSLRGDLVRPLYRDCFAVLSALIRSRLLALPTHEDNCPMVVLEAQAVGVPVMASKVSGVPDLVDGITTGLFCDPLDPRSFVEGVERLLNDRDFASKIARHAHDDAVKRFHPTVNAKRHLEIYREVIGR